MRSIRSQGIFLFVFLSLAGIFFFWAQVSWASFSRPAVVKVFNAQPYQFQTSFLAFDPAFQGGAAITTADFGTDGIKELVIGAGPGGGPQVVVYRADGSVISRFFAYDQEMKGGLQVAACDLAGDGQTEIITGPQQQAGPQIRVFDLSGQPKFTTGFFAFDPNYHGGVHLACGDVNGDGAGEIIVGVGLNAEPHVRVFNRFGVDLGIDFRPFAPNSQSGVTVAVVKADGDQAVEIAMAEAYYGEGLVKIYKYNVQQQIVSEFKTYSDFHGGLNLAGGEINGDSIEDIIIVPATGGGPHVLGYKVSGERLPVNFMAYEEDFRGGVNVAIGQADKDRSVEIITAPARRLAEGRLDLPKYIEIDISDQLLRYYQNGVKLGEYKVSSGKYSMPTPLGQFNVLGKQRRAWSAKYGLYMPFWMQFTSVGHGIHELPEWPGGYKEGLNHLGIRVSHGCVRLGIGPAEEIWNWADIGTPVIIHD